MFLRRRKLKLLLTLIITGALFVVLPAFAQTLNTGLDYAKYTGLVDTDVRVIIARIINVALGFLGVVALALVLYGGYIYMTAGGNEENIAKAKKILLNAGIGLAIILSAFAITRFVISKLSDAIIGNYTDQYCQQNPSAPECSEYCIQHPAECATPPPPPSIFYGQMAPQGQQTIKNVTVSILFFGNFNLPAEYDGSTVPPAVANIRVVKKSDQTPALGNFSLISPSRIDFNPTGSCLDDNPADSDTSDTCLEKNTVYQVILTSVIKSKNNISLDCSAHPCTFEFTTGERMDRNPPSISLAQPGNNARVAVSTNVDVGAVYGDDAGVKLVSFYQGAAKIQDVPISPPTPNGGIVIPWFTGVSSPATYELKAVAADVDNHETASAIQTVRVLPAHCFDLVKNFDEIDIDCGPTSVCGVCSGQNCQTNQDCAGNYCDIASPVHTCVVRPKITNVDPKDGAPGNYITILGNDFGVYNPGVSKVIFLGDPANFDDDKIATVVSCFGQTKWQDSYIVVKIPDEVVSGPLQVRTAAYSGAADLGHQDRSDDDWGPNFAGTVFTVNSTARPGLCGIDPASDLPSNVVQISGKQLGSIKGASNIKFGDYISEVSYWSDTSVNTKVPVLPAQTVTVKAVVNSQTSNGLPFEILPVVATSGLPHIDDISPTSGPKGAYLTVFGQNFGTAIGLVTFTQNGATFNAEPLPDYCGTPWSDTQIVVKVPAGLNISNAEVKVVRNIDHQTSNNSKTYIIDQDKRQTNLCKVEPNNGPKNTVVTLKGEGFAPPGNGGGRVVFSPFDTYVNPTAWDDKILNGALVPAGAETGPLKVITYGSGSYFPVNPLSSNLLYFKVQNCKTDNTIVCGAGTTCCASGSCLAPPCPEAVGAKFAVFAWSFSPGKMPLVPQVVKTCDSGQVPSPTPSQFWEPYDNVCINAHVKVRFNNLVDASTINNNSFLVESCDQNCSGEQAIWSPVSGSLYFSFTDGELYNTFLDQEEELNDTVDFWPTSASNLFSRNKWYRVTLTTDIKSMGWDEAAQNFNLAANMPAAPTGQCANPSGKIAAYCFNFKTRDSDTLCQLGSAVVSPKPYTATNFDTTYPSLYSVTGIASDNICWVIDSNPYDWQWNAGATAGASSIYATVTNHKQGTPLRGKPVQDLITKTLETPAIGEKVWAKTISAGQTVSDSAILHISLAPVKVVERWPDCQQGGAACINAAIGARFNMDMDASSLNKTNIILQSCAQDDKCLTPSNIPVDDFTLTPNSQGFGLSYNLAPDQYYQVTIAGGASGVKSAAGGTLKSGFFWIFKTKAAACSVDRVDIYPSSATVYWVGAEALYRGLPFGAKDDCSPVIGQLLDAASYNWSWSSVPLAVATVPLGNIFSFTSSTAVGEGTVVNKRQTAQITGSAQSKSNHADFILQCGFSPVNDDCPLLGSTYGIGKNSCCYQRPTVGLFQPAVPTNVCPNTAIVVNFNQEMDESSFTSSTPGYYNMILAEATSTANCPAGTYLVDKKEKTPYGFWQKVVFYISQFFGQPAQAEIFCAGEIGYSLGFETIPATETSVTSTRVSLLLKKPLTGGKNFKLFLTKDIKNMAGVSLASSQSFYFGTREKLCTIDHLEISPPSWLFGTAHEGKTFTAHAFYAPSNSLPQELLPFEGVYSWTNHWTINDTSIVTQGYETYKATSTEIRATSKNGVTQVGAAATIDPGSKMDNGSQYSASSTVQVFICENPWPSAIIDPNYGLGYVDALNNSNNIAQGKGWSNLKLMYCRDAGLPNNISDDLPELNTPTVLLHPGSDPVFKEFFATFKKPSETSPQPNTIKEDKNSIGLRIYPNLDHLSLPDWYLNQPWIPKGAPVPTKVGSYEAMQEGRTYYINGLNVSSTPSGGFNVYSNVYVFSFSDNPTAETLNIVNQLLNNFTLNVNVADKETINKLSRDLKRQQDLRLIADKLWQYYQIPINGNYPTLTENPALGTYLPAYTNSKWKSWQGVLGNLLSYNLPVDPQNGFVGCGSEIIPSGLVSWWKADGDAKDAVGSNHGELKNGVTFEPGKTGQAFKFDGVSDYVKSANHAPTSPVTVIMWVKPRVNQSGWITLSDNSYGSSIWAYNGNVSARFDYVWADSQTVDFGYTLTADKWVLLAFTFDKNASAPQIKTYVNGQPLATGNRTTDVNTNQGGTYIGTGITKTGYFDGSIDEIQLYNRALSSSEINKLYNGGLGDLQNFDPETCWNAINSTFICPSGSHIYQYETEGGASSTLKADFELPTYTWVNALASPTSTIIYQTTNSCSAALQGVSGKCGDGVVGQSETCEIGQSQYLSCVTSTYPGKQLQKCKTNCSIFENVGSCVAQGKCGDGVKQTNEVCDDGTNNGKYGYCNTTCSGQVAAYCGNGGVDVGKEVCDASTLLGPNGWCNVDNLIECGSLMGSPFSLSCFTKGGICQQAGAKYNKIQSQSCSWDCQSYDYCGDGRVNTNYETCEKSESCQVGVCNLGLHAQKYCEGDNDCRQGVACEAKFYRCSNDANVSCSNNVDCNICDIPASPTEYKCSDSNDSCTQHSGCLGGAQCLPVGTCRQSAFGQFTECKIDNDCAVKNNVCEEISPHCNYNTSLSCASDSDCTKDIKCEKKVAGKKYCKAPNEVKYRRMFPGPYFQDATSTASISPTASLIYTDSNKTCTWEKTHVTLSYFATTTISCLPFKAPELPSLPASCGNGKIESGEVCDDGVNTGTICVPNLPTFTSCTYCAYGCQEVITVSQ